MSRQGHATLLLALAFGTNTLSAAVGTAGEPVPQPATRPAGQDTSPRARAAAAERVYQMLERQEVVGGKPVSIERVEIKIGWSRRWAAAVVEQAASAAERTAAAQAHLNRVKEMADRVLGKTDVEGEWFAAFDFHLAEARLWVERQQGATQPK